MDSSWVDLIGQASGAVGHVADAAQKVAPVLVAVWLFFKKSSDFAPRELPHGIAA